MKRTRDTLAKYGFRATLSQLVYQYRLDDLGNLDQCNELTDKQFACVLKHPTPLVSNDDCKHDKVLAVRPSLSSSITLSRRAVSNAYKRRIQLYLRGDWKCQDPQRKQTCTLRTGSSGATTKQCQRGGRAVGKLERIRLAFRYHGWLGLVRAPNHTQSVAFFVVSRNEFLLSWSRYMFWPTHVPNTQEFNLLMHGDQMLYMRKGRCRVYDFAYQVSLPFRCHWVTHKTTGYRALRLRMRRKKAGWGLRASVDTTFYLINRYLIPEEFYRNRCVRLKQKAYARR